MEKIEVAKKVAGKLFAAENAIDDAMVQTSQFLECMVEARRELKLSAMAGEVATSRTVESISALSEARRAVMAAHNALSSLARKLDMQESDIGPGTGQGKDSGVEPAAHAGLRLAAGQ